VLSVIQRSRRRSSSKKAIIPTVVSPNGLARNLLLNPAFGKETAITLANLIRVCVSALSLSHKHCFARSLSLAFSHILWLTCTLSRRSGLVSLLCRCRCHCRSRTVALACSISRLRAPSLSSSLCFALTCSLKIYAKHTNTTPVRGLSLYLFLFTHTCAQQATCARQATTFEEACSCRPATTSECFG